jgi:peptidoglycan/xylan/chitin deacetylase (PgdA/CDA1 family)
MAKEVALSFDDAPFSSTSHFSSIARTELQIKKLKELGVPSVLVFANACNRNDPKSIIEQLKLYQRADHLIGNHSCSHLDLDKVGTEAFIKNIEENDKLLAQLFTDQKFFRFPYLHEGKVEKVRDEIRAWLKLNKYRNGMVSIDTDDYIFSSKTNEAKKLGKNIDYKKLEAVFIDHLISTAEFYEDLAIKTLGYSPKHIILLHEMDMTVMFIDSLVNELRKKGWKIISAKEAYDDRLYQQEPKNTYANDGIIAQVAMDKTGKKFSYQHLEEIIMKLDEILK